MPSLKLKKATMLTSFLLLSPIVLTSLYFIPRINNYHYVFFIFVMMSCWIIGGSSEGLTCFYPQKLNPNS